MGTERYRVKTRIGEGNIIGDLLRKYATRSTYTWQIIGYATGKGQPNFGMEGSKCSYLGLLEGKLEDRGISERAPNTVLCMDFKWSSNAFVSDSARITGLHSGFGASLQVYIAYASGHRSAKQNLEEIKRFAPNNAAGVFAVASSHSTVGTFKYHVQSQDDTSELLLIEADNGAAERAIKAAFSAIEATKEGFTMSE